MAFFGQEVDNRAKAACAIDLSKFIPYCVSQHLAVLPVFSRASYMDARRAGGKIICKGLG